MINGGSLALAWFILCSLMLFIMELHHFFEYIFSLYSISVLIPSLSIFIYLCIQKNARSLYYDVLVFQFFLWVIKEVFYRKSCWNYLLSFQHNILSHYYCILYKLFHDGQHRSILSFGFYSLMEGLRFLDFLLMFRSPFF
jgi:hypothetical protein